ncbi:hypothetical protein CYMTET_33156 [Cymbomonas tetramitiformis]|uniref:Uncharacterized protein n=1 Tax=Cymbomonas tetramitiformis TaxID=36881 RepID=A0AAE0FDM6_9CHLO|nr:hypothetical protein CYMTET_33156 [Cymbomonas tetramitiformis]
MSCEIGAGLKARQACAEDRALRRCKAEKQLEKAAGKLSAEEEMLALCLKGSPKCDASAEMLRDIASQLPGVRMLAKSRPRCIFDSLVCAHIECLAVCTAPALHLRQPGVCPH